MRFSLSKISFVNILVTVLVFSSILGVFIYGFTNAMYENRIKDLEKNFYEKNKELVKNEVKRTIKSIETIKTQRYIKSENELREKVNFIINMLNKQNIDGDIEKVINNYENIFDSIKWDNDSGYFFIFDKKGKVLYHGADKKMENKNLLDLSKNNKNLNTLINKAIENGSYFGFYDWYKPNEDKQKLFKKYAYIKKDEKYNIFIATGIYKKDIDKSIQDILFKDVASNRFGKNNYGYFWINGLDNILKVHPLNPDLLGSNLKEFKTLDGKYIFDEMNKIAKSGGGFVSYEWFRPDNLIKDKKVSYVELIGDWPLVIGSGFYLTELEELLVEEKVKLKVLSKDYLKNVYSILFILTLVVILIARYISFRIIKIEQEKDEQFNMLEQYKLVLDKSSVVSKTNKDGIITYVNDEFEKVSGFSKDDAMGKFHNLVRHPDTPKTQFKKLWENIGSGHVWKGIVKNKKKNGESYYNKTTIVPIKNSKGEILEYISSAMDVTELVENRTKLQNLFKTDTLTGLGNRISMIDLISKNESGILALVNIDRFQEVNDSYSHEIGDIVIKSLANRLFEFFDNSVYYLYRVQADIFAIFSIESPKKKFIKDITEFLNSKAKEPYEIESYKFILSYTCGVASNSDSLLTYADVALSEAKNKNLKILEYDESMTNISKFRDNIQWVERLHLALKEDRILPHYQPIYNYSTGKIEKYEALMRLEENGEIIYPNEYLKIAKNTKLYPELTYKMVEKVFSRFSQNNLEFSINLSVEDLMNEELIIFILDYAEQKDVFNRMVIEIIESEEIEDSDHISKVIKKFKDLGAKIAIDDFGSGYSNYEYLIKLQADYLKIDGSIIKLINSDNRTLQVVKAIVEFAKKSDIKIIAEFVSDKSIDTIIREIGIDYAQGFYYGKPKEELLT